MKKEEYYALVQGRFYSGDIEGRRYHWKEGIPGSKQLTSDLEAGAAMARRSKTGAEPDRLEREKVEFFEAVRQAYLAMAKSEPQRWLIVDASQTVDQMQAQIRTRIDQVLASR